MIYEGFASVLQCASLQEKCADLSYVLCFMALGDAVMPQTYAAEVRKTAPERGQHLTASLVSSTLLAIAIILGKRLSQVLLTTLVWRLFDRLTHAVSCRARFDGAYTKQAHALQMHNLSVSALRVIAPSPGSASRYGSEDSVNSR